MQSVYGLRESPSLQRPLSFFSRIGKPLAVSLPILVAGLLQMQSLMKSPVWFFITANVLCESPPNSFRTGSYLRRETDQKMVHRCLFLRRGPLHAWAHLDRIHPDAANPSEVGEKCSEVWHTAAGTELHP